MHRLFVFIGVLTLAQSWACAEDEVRVLFEATITKEDGALVHSGPGNQYYATSKIQRGERVKVFRKDADSWLMIAPPRGSFSWVSASDFGWATDMFREYVHTRGTSQVTAHRVDVHAGSDLDPEAVSTISAQLHKGDAVNIIGTHKFNLDDGPQEMMKIQPVRGEWRWIHSDSIRANEDIPSEFGARHRGDRQMDPIAEDPPRITRHKPRQHHEDRAPAVAVQDESVDSMSNDKFSRRSEQAEFPGQRRLRALDRQFRDMVQQDPVVWDLDSVERLYRQLDQEVGDTSLSSMITARLDAVDRYRNYYLGYADFVKMTSETRRRDAQLVAQQSLYQAGYQGYQGQFNVTPAAGIQTNAQYPMTVQPRAVTPRYDGAGIVRRIPDATDAGPRYALVAPDGRTLSYLQSTQGVDLGQYEGRAMGITGLRYFRRDWNADTIAVRDLQPVQLSGPR